MTTRHQLDAEEAIRRYTEAERRRLESTQALIGDGAGNIQVPGRTGWAYIRLHGHPSGIVEAKMPAGVPLVQDVAVDVERVLTGGMNFYQVQERSAFVRYGSDPFWTSGTSGGVAAHATQHQRRDRNTGGFDPLDVYTRALTTCRATAHATPDMSIYVQAGYYYILGYQSWPGGDSPTFTVPTDNLSVARYDLLYLYTDGQLHIAQGTPSLDPSVLPSFPTLPANSVPLAFVYLTNGTTAIDESLIVDARVILTAATTLAAGNAPANAPYVIAGNPSNYSLSGARMLGDAIGSSVDELALMIQRHVVEGW